MTLEVGSSFLVLSESIGVFNLVTKQRFYQKPTYNSLVLCLKSLRDQCLDNDVKEIAIPLLGCGLDNLSWGRVSAIITAVFFLSDINIVVYVKD